MSIFVIVHGGFMGGWAWTPVAKLLRAAGHEVFTPTLSGLGERAHLANPETGLDTHIQDIVGVLECEDLSQVILVGHSYGSMVITGVAEKVPERLAYLVYLDTAVPKDGQSWLDILGREMAALCNEITKKGDGWRINMVPSPPKWQPQPLKTCTDPLEVRNPTAARIPRGFIHCTAKSKESAVALAFPAIDRAAESAQQAGW
jgi:pimeloyl-ACP methyl ester carboxylesterase